MLKSIIDFLIIIVPYDELEEERCCLYLCADVWYNVTNDSLAGFVSGVVSIYNDCGCVFVCAI